MLEMPFCRAEAGLSDQEGWALPCVAPEPCRFVLRSELAR